MTDRVCLFCRKPGARSREHAWGQWFSRLLDEPVRHRLEGANGPTRPEWWSRLMEPAPRVVCRECNNGWMSALEESASRILKPLMADAFHALRLGDDEEDQLSGQQRLLTPELRTTLSLWAAKTAIVMVRMHGERDPTIPDPHAHCIYERRLPPPNYAIWLGYIAGGDQVGFHRSRRLWLAGVGKGFVSTYTIGPLVFQVIGTHELGVTTEISIDDSVPIFSFVEHVVQLWPLSVPPEPWPPILYFERSELESYSDPDPMSTPVRAPESRGV